MTRLCIVAEGQTEETFIEEILRPLLTDHGVVLMPSIQMNGNVKYKRLKDLVVRRLKEQSTAFCTTFVDYYGRSSAFPGEESIGEFDPVVRKKKILENAFRADVEEAMGRGFDGRRFIPYIQMYEFEGLLFSDPERFAQLREVRRGIVIAVVEVGPRLAQLLLRAARVGRIRGQVGPDAEPQQEEPGRHCRLSVTCLKYCSRFACTCTVSKWSA